MFKTVKRIIDWCGEFKGKLYLGFVMTFITIAHRLATVQNADQILVVEDGRIAECGTHEELIRKEGLYKKFTEIREQAEGWRIETR